MASRSDPEQWRGTGKPLKRRKEWTPMSRKYRLEYESPHGKCRAEADSLVELVGMVSERVAMMITPEISIEGLGLDDAAKEVLRVYKMLCKTRNKRRYRATSLAQAGVELDVIRCYLQNMTIDNIIEWLNLHKKTSLSKSAVGRFCTALFRLGVSPIGTFEIRS